MKTTLKQQQMPGKFPSTTYTPSKGPDEKILEAHRQADHDIEMDPDFMLHTRTHDLDEGEIARLGED